MVSRKLIIVYCRLPFLLVVEVMNEWMQNGCFKLAEKLAASSLSVGGRRYMGISCMSTLLWV